MKYINKIFLGVILSVTTSCAPVTHVKPAVDTRLPNIVIFYADDLGYGDLGSYGAEEIQTPNVDRLADGGVRFTDAHAAAATCTPSRYSLLTGEYPFRAQADILDGDAPLMIRPGMFNLAHMLKDSGYATAVIGKWHLGLGNGYVDWNDTVKPGPVEIGFDYSFISPATGDRVPTVYVENHDVVGLDQADPISISYKERIGNRPVGYERPELLKVGADRQHSDVIVNGVSRIGYMKGGASAEWVDEEFPDVFTSKAVSFLRGNQDKPFFLFFSFNEPHVPRIPHPRFQGATDLGARGDTIVQMDWMTGRIMEEIKTLGLERNTLVIFTSDNGPVLNDGYEDGAVELLGDHTPWGPFRGGKYSAYEAGARVPTIVYWPGKTGNGTSDALVSQVDIVASLASLVGVDLPDSVAIDSRNLLDTWLGNSSTGRDYLFKQSIPTMAVRQGLMKYIAPVETMKPSFTFMEGKGIEGGQSLSPQLYDLESDVGEQNNLARERIRDVADMQKIIDDIRARTKATGRSAKNN